MSIYLGVDIGTTSTKCLAVRDDGQVIASSQHHYPMLHPQQGWAEQHPEDYWYGLAATVRGCLRMCSRRRHRKEDVALLALSTQGDTLIVTDGDGNALMHAISWMDARGQAEFEELLSEADASVWYREMGSPLNALSSACTLRWLAKNRPDIMSAKPRFCYVADYLAKRLCGRFATDVPSASWTPMFSPARRGFSQPVLDLLGVRPEALPDVLESGEIIGKLLPEVAKELGLAPETKLIAGAFDQAAAAHGAGARADGRSVLSCGTAWVLYAVAPGGVVDPNERLCSCCHTGRGENGLVLPFSGGSTYDWLTKIIGEVGDDDPPSSADPLVFVPHLYGGLSPDWCAESKGTLAGLTLAHNRADMRLALMRGLGCEARRNMEAAEQLSGDVRSIRMVGGATNSRKWPQLVANVLNRPIEVSEETETACYGAAMLAAGELSAGWPESQRVSRFDPLPAEAIVEEEHYNRYLNVYELMKSVYEPKG